MPVNDGNIVKRESQYIDNLSFDESTGLSMVELAGSDGTSVFRQPFDATGAPLMGNQPYALKITQVGNIKYIAKALPGTAQSAAGWQAQQIDQTTGTVITWADGNALFDNIATDLTTLSYS